MSRARKCQTLFVREKEGKVSDTFCRHLLYGMPIKKDLTKFRKEIKISLIPRSTTS